MARKPRAGDVVTYRSIVGCDDELASVALVSRRVRDNVYVSAWKHPNDRWHATEYEGGLGLLVTGDVELHPEPDKIWADFIAWKLLNAG